MPLGSCHNHFSLGSLAQLISSLTSHHSGALQEAGRLVLWPEWIPLFESNSCMSHPSCCLWKSRRKGQCYTVWAFQGPSVSGHWWKAVVPLAWPEAAGLSSPNAKEKGEHSELKLVSDWEIANSVTEKVTWCKISSYYNALSNTGSYTKLLPFVFNLI